MSIAGGAGLVGEALQQEVLDPHAGVVELRLVSGHHDAAPGSSAPQRRGTPSRAENAAAAASASRRACARSSRARDACDREVPRPSAASAFASASARPLVVGGRVEHLAVTRRERRPRIATTPPPTGGRRRTRTRRSARARRTARPPRRARDRTPHARGLPPCSRRCPAFARVRRELRLVARRAPSSFVGEVLGHVHDERRLRDDAQVHRHVAVDARRVVRLARHVGLRELRVEARGHAIAAAATWSGCASTGIRHEQHPRPQLAQHLGELRPRLHGVEQVAVRQRRASRARTPRTPRPHAATRPRASRECRAASARRW